MKASTHLEKIVVNVGLGRLSHEPNFEAKILPEIEKEIALITSQKPAKRPAKKSIAGFKIREGDIVGLKITLRQNRMEDFLNRLNNLVLPRVKDFRGLSLKNIDTNGNLNIGLKDQFIFPEINPNVSRFNFGLQITMVSKISNREKMIDFYRSIGVPLKLNP